MNGDARASKRVSSSRNAGKDARRYAEVASLEELRAKVRQARSKRTSLQADIARLRSAPSKVLVAEQDREGEATKQALSELSLEALHAEERTILYRTSGWTVFEIDLDVGRRERALRRHQDIDSSRGDGHDEDNEKASLGLGVRLDTFWRGRFYEPFYLVFGRSSQLVRDVPAVSGGIDAGVAAQAVNESSSKDAIATDGQASTSSSARVKTEPLRLLRHTIPHFVPLQTLVRQFLPSQQTAPETRHSGGLDHLKSLMDRQGLFTFLGHLHSHLQAYIARREQTIALSKIALPSERPSNLVAHGNDAFAHLTIRWDMPMPTEADVIAVQRNGKVLRHTRSNAKVKSQVAPVIPEVGDERISLRIDVKYTDFASSHLAGEHSESTDRDVSSKSERLRSLQSLSKASAPDEEGLRCNNGSVLVQLVRHRIAAPRRGGDGATTVAADLDTKEATVNSAATASARVSRRREWERVFCDRDLDRAVDQILTQAWKDEMVRYEVLDSTGDDKTAAASVSFASHDLSI